MDGLLDKCLDNWRDGWVDCLFGWLDGWQRDWQVWLGGWWLDCYLSVCLSGSLHVCVPNPLFCPSACLFFHIQVFLFIPSATFSLISSMSNRGEKGRLGNLACLHIQNARMLAYACSVLFSCFVFALSPFLSIGAHQFLHIFQRWVSSHASPLLIIRWQLLGTNTHTHKCTAGYGFIPCGLILIAPLGSRQLSLIHLWHWHCMWKMKCVVVCGSEFKCMYVGSQTHISHTNAAVTGVLEVSPVYTQKQPQTLL